MKCILDANVYSDAKTLKKYLEGSSNNTIVLTDYVAIETLKSGSTEKLFNTTSLLSRFPSQVIVLKPTNKLFKLSGKATGLTRRMIDTQQTSQFSKYCELIGKAKEGNFSLMRQVRNLKSLANEHMAVMLDDVDHFIEGIQLIHQVYSSKEKEILNKRVHVPIALKVKVMDLILELTELLRKMHGLPAFKENKEIRNTLIFRQSVCLHALTFFYLRRGFRPDENTNKERIRNDLIDTHYSSLATFFDGLLSHDVKQKEVYEETKVILQNLFRAEVSRSQKYLCHLDK